MLDDKYEVNKLACSLPLVKLARKMKPLPNWALLEFTTDNPCFEDDIRLWCRDTGNILCNFRRENAHTSVVIMKCGYERAAAAGDRD